MSDRKPDANDEQTAAPCPEARRKPVVRPGQPETWPKEIGGQKGPEPTRYGDWEKNGRCSDF